MGLFSKKKESHTIEEAIKNDDVSFEHTTSKGNTYKNFPSIVVGVENSFAGFDDIDDSLEKFRCRTYRIKYVEPKKIPVSGKMIFKNNES